MGEPVAITVVDVLGAQYQTTRAADVKCGELLRRFGYKHRYFAARLAIARSLSLPDPPPQEDGEDDPATPIRGQQLFRDTADAAAWLAIVSEAAGKDDLSLADFKRLIARHWGRGATLLMQDWEDAKGDLSTFVTKLAELARLPAEGYTSRAGVGLDRTSVPAAVSVPIGEDAATGEPVVWAVNAKGSAPHSALMGASGKGKTTTAITLLRSIREATGVPVIVFDFKADLTQPDKALDRLLGASVVSPRTAPIPLDVLHLSDRSQNEITIAAQKLCDMLSALKGSGFGPTQKNLFVEAAERALRAHVPCTLEHVRNALRALYDEQGRNPDGATNTLDGLCRLPLFEPSLSPAEFFARSWIIQVPDALSQSVRVSVVTLIAEALNRHLGELGDAPTDAEGNRALRVMFVIDEAHNVLETHLDAVGRLLRVSRSRGGAVMLISQRPDDFDAADADFLADMGLILSFQTNAQAKSVERLFAKGASVATLGRGEAWVKMGEAARRVVVWR